MDWEDKIVGIVGISRDITSLKKIEQALYTEKELLMVTLQSIKDGVITTDKNGNIVMFNKAAEALTGWDKNQAKDKEIHSIYNIINKNTEQKCKSQIYYVLRTGNAKNLGRARILLSKDGTKSVI